MYRTARSSSTRRIVRPGSGSAGEVIARIGTWVTSGVHANLAQGGLIARTLDSHHPGRRPWVVRWRTELPRLGPIARPVYVLFFVVRSFTTSRPDDTSPLRAHLLRALRTTFSSRTPPSPRKSAGARQTGRRPVWGRTNTAIASTNSTSEARRRVSAPAPPPAPQRQCHYSPFGTS